MSEMNYCVMKTKGGGSLWLGDDEKTWTPDFHSAAVFTSPDLAADIGKRETGSNHGFYVLGCMIER